MMLVQVRHNIEVAHRLSLLKGKCEAIHDHSMWVELSLMAYRMNENGILVNHDDDPLEFGGIKKLFRRHLDDTYDHKLLLNKDDPWAQRITSVEPFTTLPGLVPTPGDPSTENIAYWVATWAAKTFGCDANVKVQETAVNAASIGVKYDPES